MKLWLVTIDEDDWNYDEFVEAAVWADGAEEAEALVRTVDRADSPHSGDTGRFGPSPWVKPEWRLHVHEAPTEGLVLVHWHAG